MEKKKYWIDFGGSISVDAFDDEDAKDIFWNFMSQHGMIKFVEILEVEETD